MIKKDTSHWIDQSEISSYLHDVRRYQPLTREEEKITLQKIRAGCERSREALINSSLRFVISMAKQYQNQGLSLNDLISEGNYGLIKAAERFDDGKEVRFLSYAVWWIRQSILQSLHENSRTIRLPVNVINDMNHLRGEMPDDALDGDTPESLLGLPKLSSLDVPLDEEGNSYHDILEDSAAQRTDLAFADDRVHLMAKLKSILSTLNESEEYVITHYFGRLPDIY